VALMDSSDAMATSIEEFAQAVSDMSHRHGYDDSICLLADLIRKDVYSYYPFLFLEAFVESPSPSDLNLIRKLNLASCFYFMYLLVSDRLIDEDHSNDPAELVLVSGDLQYKAFQLLAELFPSSSTFWRLFAGFQEQFADAVLEERKNHFRGYHPFFEEDLARIASGKCAVAKTATAALAVLFDKKSLVDPFSLSQDYFHTAFQLADDVRDWRKDYEAKHYSFVLSKVIDVHGLCEQIESTSRPDAELIGKMLYFSGVAESALGMSQTYYDKALTAVSGISCENWEHAIQSRMQNALRDKNFLARVRRAEVAGHTAPPLTAPKKGTVVQNAEETISSCSAFLLSRFDESTHWSDFLTSAGESSDWVTGYVGSSLCKQDRDSPLLREAVKYLESNRFPTGGWGYSRWACVDADSTIACLRFLHRCAVDREKLRDDLAALMRNQKPNGGFSTYASPEEICHLIGAKNDEQLVGWCSPHLCVTAVALQVLLELGFEKESVEVQSAIDFILSRQSSEGYWESYWWDGRIYSTAHSVKGLVHAGQTECKEAIEKGIQWLLAVQLQDGGWNNGNGGESKPFHTGLAVQALGAGLRANHRDALKKGFQWIIANQLSDGSWASCRVLRVPDANCLRPWEKKDWRKGHGGTGIIVEDHYRLFTTATVLDALTSCRDLIHGLG
jgi:prenyltransferase beta subunit/geranylgeranyl pyrophosphate synthase